MQQHIRTLENQTELQITTLKQELVEAKQEIKALEQHVRTVENQTELQIATLKQQLIQEQKQELSTVDSRAKKDVITPTSAN